MEIILGPPGCGKTTHLLEQMEGELDRGVPPERIGFVSFTRRAAQEAKDRATIKFKLGPHQLRWVRTLHSLCFKALGLDRSAVFEGKKLQEFAAYVGHKISNITSMEEGGAFGSSVGDRCLYMDNMARISCVPLRQYFDNNYDGILWPVVEHFSQSLIKYKQVKGLVDYTDMLAAFAVSADWHNRMDVLLVDEAQDLSVLQWRVVERLAQGVPRVCIAGDDDQAIYRWAGAAVDHFIELPGTVTVLNHSWRVPPEVQALALSIVGQIKHRRPKEWHPRDGSGTVRRVGSLEGADIDVNEDTLILARNTCFLRDDVMRFLYGLGILYEYHGRLSVRQSLVNAIVAWERLRKGGEVPVDTAARIYEEMQVGVGFTRGHKKLPAYKDREQMVTLEDLKEAGGLLTDAIWHEALTKATAVERIYMLQALRGGQKLTEPSKIRISTIHGAKGAQADHVVLLTDMAWRTYDEARRLPDDEARTWYVAVTRAKHKLTVISQQSRHSTTLINV